MRTRQRTLCSIFGLALVVGCQVAKLFDAPPVKVIGVTPGTVTDFSVGSVTDSSATLYFTEVSDGTGQPAKYDIRWAAGTIDWTSAPSVTRGSCTVPVAGSAVGTYRKCTVLGLQPLTDYQFQLVAFRGTMNADAQFGDLSNVASGTTAAAPPPPATYLEFTGQPPASLVLNNEFSVEVTARDAQGATAIGYADTISLTLQGSIVTGGLSGRTRVAAVNGVATFDHLSVTGLCTGCTLKAAAPGLAGATSSTFDVIGP